MKYPPYIEEKLIKQTKALYNYVRQTQGQEQAFIFKKLALTAAYGEMYDGRMEYDTFLYEIQDFLYRESNRWRQTNKKTLIKDFWNIGHCGHYALVFNVKCETIINSTLEELETEIIQQLTVTHTIRAIKIHNEQYQLFYKQLLKEKNKE